MKKQRIINIMEKGRYSLSGDFDFDEYTTKLNEEGWRIMQIASTSFIKEGTPSFVISLLIEEA